MNEHQRQTAQQCKQAAEDNTMDFPDIVKQLIQAGFERYIVDFCKSTITYYLPCGESLMLEASREDTTVTARFDIEAMQSAIKEAQMKVVGYTYKKFCKKVMAAGCIGYIVSFLGRRAAYFGRTGEIHVEYFPN